LFRTFNWYLIRPELAHYSPVPTTTLAFKSWNDACELFNQRPGRWIMGIEKKFAFVDTYLYTAKCDGPQLFLMDSRHKSQESWKECPQYPSPDDDHCFQVLKWCELLRQRTGRWIIGIEKKLAFIDTYWPL
jgi:hypothetical protein